MKTQFALNDPLSPALSRGEREIWIASGDCSGSMMSDIGKVPLRVFERLLVFLLAVSLSTAALAGDLRAYFDRKSVYEGDTVTLVIETTGGSLEQPDLSGLGADFDLLGTSQSTNISIVNGERTDTIRLLVTLSPRRTGTIEVPPIKIGDEQTGALTLQVSEVPEGGSGGGGDDIFVELEVGAESGELMVQQQVPVTVRLFTAVPLLNGRLEDPRVEGALVTKLGEDRQYDTRRDGREYRVIERRYTLSPERSGELRIPPVRFEGSVRTSKGRRGGSRGGIFNDPFFERFFEDGPLSRDPFGMFDRGQPVNARSRGITLDVKARPGAYAGDHWLPAQELEIVDSWAESPPELRVGEPVIRTLTLQAKGLSGPQIPEIEIAAIPGLRVYPEKGDSETRSDGETVYGIARQEVTLIPSEAGELTIPEIRVTWWDTGAQHERVATVPGWTLNVAAGRGAEPVPEPPAQPAERAVPDLQDETTDQILQEAAEGADMDSLLAGSDRRYLTAGAIGLALLLAGAWGLRRHRRSRPSPVRAGQTTAGDPHGSHIDTSEAKRSLRVACETNDDRGAAKALMAWAEATWPEDAPRNLGALRARLAGGADQVGELEQHIYAPDTGHWDGAALWRALQGGLSDARGSNPQGNDLLQPLYPRRP